MEGEGFSRSFAQVSRVNPDMMQLDEPRQGERFLGLDRDGFVICCRCCQECGQGQAKPLPLMGHIGRHNQSSSHLPTDMISDTWHVL